MNSITQVKRYHIAKVYRRDQPAIARGRFREFHQCDFDIAGVYDPMIPDAEILCVINEIFAALKLNITIKLNHRKILDGMFTVAGVPADKIRPISSAVDKLDKMPWDEVKKEMVEDKGLAEASADQIGEFVRNSGSIQDMIAYLRSNQNLLANDDIQAGLADMELLDTYLQALGAGDSISFDLSLARGLDYYTSLIYEVILTPPTKEEVEAARKASKGKKSKEDPSLQVGSIAAGGRYDNLVGMYGKKQIPCVGISFGVDRIFTILKARAEKDMRAREVDVFVMAVGGKEFTGLLPERMSISRTLWNADIRAEFSPKVKPRLPQQFKAAEDAGVPLAVILGEDELKAGQVRLKVLGAAKDKDEKDNGRLVPTVDLVAEVKKILAA